MNPRISRPIVGALIPLALLLCAGPASGTMREPEPYSMEVLVDGVPLPEYSARGTTYVDVAVTGQQPRFVRLCHRETRMWRIGGNV